MWMWKWKWMSMDVDVEVDVDVVGRWRMHVRADNAVTWAWAGKPPCTTCTGGLTPKGCPGTGEEVACNGNTTNILFVPHLAPTLALASGATRGSAVH